MGELETFETPSKHVATFETDELTARCPFDFGGPDFYTLTLKYEPRGYCVESKSLKQLLQGYRDVEITAEALATDIHERVTKTIRPEWCYVRLEQARRGGIEETVEVGTDESST